MVIGFGCRGKREEKEMNMNILNDSQMCRETPPIFIYEPEASPDMCMTEIESPEGEGEGAITTITDNDNDIENNRNQQMGLLLDPINGAGSTPFKTKTATGKRKRKPRYVYGQYIYFSQTLVLIPHPYLDLETKTVLFFFLSLPTFHIFFLNTIALILSNMIFIGFGCRGNKEHEEDGTFLNQKKTKRSHLSLPTENKSNISSGEIINAHAHESHTWKQTQRYEMSE